jgi:carboxypeptidase Q
MKWFKQTLASTASVTGSFLPAVLLACLSVQAQNPPPAAISPATRDAVQQMIGDTLLNGKAYEYDEYLADNIGPRLTGSSNYMHAAEWVTQQMKSIGLANVHTEGWTIPDTWEPETPAEGRIIAPIEHRLHIYSLGWSPSTPKTGVEGNIVYLPSLEIAELDKQKSALQGSIALIDSASLSTAQTLDKLCPALDHLHAFAVKAILEAGGPNGTEVMGSGSFTGNVDSIPEAQIGLEDALLIKRLLNQGRVRVQFSFANSVRSHITIPNVVAEIPGGELANQVVIVGAHLDSWQPGTGAQDNGTGVAMVLEAARTIMATHRAPRRTIRFVLFGGEEEGLLGSVAYVRQHKAELPNIDAVLITDSGSQPAKGWVLMGRDDEKSALAPYEPLLGGLGADDTTSNTDFIFDTDHAPFHVHGVPSLVLWTPMDKYDLLHHQASDTFDSVVQKDLTQDAAVVAITAYVIADSQQPFAPHLSDEQVQAVFKTAGHLDELKFLEARGLLP